MKKNLLFGSGIEHPPLAQLPVLFVAFVALTQAWMGCQVAVDPTPRVTGITMTGQAEMKVGDGLELVVVVTGKGNFRKDFVVSSTDPETIKAVQDGSKVTLTALRPGSASILATAGELEAKADFTIQVPSPTFSVAAGTFTDVQSVTLACAYAKAAIRYTLDETDPSATTGTLYEGLPIGVTKSATLKAIAYTGTLVSPISSAQYVLDLPLGDSGLSVTSPWSPTITFSGKQASLSAGTTMTVVATVAPAPNTYAWYMDGVALSGATARSYTTNAALSVGSHVLVLIATRGTVMASEQINFSVKAP